ncbi:MAG: PAS domain-containing protein [Bacteroidota bacterium]|nr:PAS domain-containing protein [Bacteroidota bacterium]
MKLKDTSVRVKLNGIIALLLIFGVTAYLLIFNFNAQRANDALKVELSGKNRFYSQRIAVLTGLLQSPNQQIAGKAKEDLVICLEAFHNNLRTLKEGKEVTGSELRFSIEPADKITTGKITALENILKGVDRNIQFILKEKGKPPIKSTEGKTTDSLQQQLILQFLIQAPNQQNVMSSGGINQNTSLKTNNTIAPIKSNDKKNTAFYLRLLSDTIRDNSLSGNNTEEHVSNPELDSVYAETEQLFLSNSLLNAAQGLVDHYSLAALKKQSEFYNFLILLGALNGVILLFAYWAFKRYITDPIHKLRDIARLITDGDFAHKCKVSTKDEIGEIAQSINDLIDNSTKASNFADNIGQGKLDIEFKAKSEKDVLGQSLLVMRDNLISLSHEEAKRNWTTKGLAMFGEILRSNNSDLIELSNSIISNLVKYLNANQGSIFIVNDEKPSDIFIELKASYAWNKKKHLKMRIELGEGLLGQTWQEGETVFLTDIPSDFINITSGLGDASPNCIIIVPLKVNGQIYGVVEIASFHVFEKHQIDFLEKLGESIASTVSTTKINEKTKVLLVQSQQQTEEMRSQEEELRQNMEEMQATQEEMERVLSDSRKQQSEMSARMAQVDLACIVSEADLKGNITFVNDKFCEVSKYTREELIGKPHSIVRHPDMPAEAFKQMWATIGSGKIFRAEVKNKAKDGTPYWVDAIIAPVLGENGKPIKYIGIRYDITENKQMQLQLQEQMQQMQQKEEELRQNIEEMNATQEEMQRVLVDSRSKQSELNTRMAQVDEACLVSETDLKGVITFVNKKFCEVAKYAPEELLGKPHNIVRHPDMPAEAFKQMWATIGSGKIFRAEVKNKAKDGTPYWVDAIIAPVLGENGKPVKYIGIRYDITATKKMQLALEEQMQLMRVKEEELRQHVEEMRAIQEDLEKKNQELQKRNKE